jgi:hypothetical protein
MGYLSMLPSQCEKKFYNILNDSSSFDATEWLYEYSVKNGYVRLIYNVLDDDFILVPNSNVSVRVEYKTLKNQYLVLRKMFDNFEEEGSTKNFLYRYYVNGEYVYKLAEVTLVQYYEEYALIKWNNMQSIEEFYVINR